MNDIMSTLRNMVWNLTHRIRITDMIDILIVAVIIYELLLLTRHTRGSALLKGLFLLIIIALLSNLLGFISLNWLLTAILQNGAIVLVVLFQPEFIVGRIITVPGKTVQLINDHGIPGMLLGIPDHPQEFGPFFYVLAGGCGPVRIGLYDLDPMPVRKFGTYPDLPFDGLLCLGCAGVAHI